MAAHSMPSSAKSLNLQSKVAVKLSLASVHEAVDNILNISSTLYFMRISKQCLLNKHPSI
jgi:hypothetical protein